MTHSTSGRTPPSKPSNGQVRLRRRAPSREGNFSHDSGVNQLNKSAPSSRVCSPSKKTRMIMEADNVGLEQSIAALTRIPIRHRKH